MKTGAIKVYCHGELVSARHMSGEFWKCACGEFWKCACGEFLRLLVPAIHLPADQELDRLVATQRHGGLSSLVYSGMVPLPTRFQ